MKMTARVYVFLVLGALLSACVHASPTVILQQAGSPIQITSYEAFYDERDTDRYSAHPEQITHKLKYKNVSGKEIVAMKSGMVAFDAFNDLLTTLNGWAIQKLGIDKETEGRWEDPEYRAFTFETYGTGVAYVRAVRFADGTIWKADMDKVLEELKKFESSLKKEDLEEKEPPK